MRHRQRSHHPALAAVTAVSLVVAACTGGDDSATTTEAVTTTAGTTTTTTPAPSTTLLPTSTVAPSTTSTTVPAAESGVSGLRNVAPFADYQWVPPLDDTATYRGPSTPTSLDDVLLTPTQSHLRNPDTPELNRLVEQLEVNGFAVVGWWGGTRFFHDGYKASAYDSYKPIFVTTDALYHSWHLVFDRALRDTEQHRLLPILEEFLAGAVDGARAQERSLTGTDLADAAHRATAYYEAAAMLLEVDVGPINDLASAEVEAVEAAAGMQTSPITGLRECQAPGSFVGCIDFSLFRPRGHYTRTPELGRYFRAMSLLGQEGFALADGIGVVPGLLVTRVILDDPALLAGWTSLYEPTAFLVGLADDIDPLQLAAAATQAAPGWIEDPTVLADTDAESIAGAVLADHPVAIDPERAAVRVMGARFTLDAFVLDQLAWPNVGREPPDERRVHVSALDVAAAFGSPLARDLQLATEATYDRYEEQLDAMTAVVTGRQPDDWAGTVYDAWLVAIEPQFRTRGSRYPDFMRSDAWAAKSLQTGLGSYTELKHDTVLYTKQGASSEGEGPEGPDFVPRHWVEPDPVAFGRISAAAGLLRDGFADRDLLTDETEDLLATLIELTDWLGGIAARELEGTVASDAENDRLRHVGSELEYLWIASSEINLDRWSHVPDPNERAALVTDIFTTSFDYLQLGTGAIDSIDVIVPLGDGRFELAVGFVYSYYEFWRPTSEPRLTDEEWRWIVREDQTPPRPSWTAAFVVGAPIADDPIVQFSTTDLPAPEIPLGEVLQRYDQGVFELEPHTYSVSCPGLPYNEPLSRGDVLRCEINLWASGVVGWYLVVLDDFGNTTSWMIGTEGADRPPVSDGLLCREYLALPEVVAALASYGESPPWNDSKLAYQWALAYWFEQGQPVRMDVDDNAIPCELLFNPAVVAEVWAGDH